MVRVIEYRSEAGPAPVLEIAVYRDLGGSHWQHSICTIARLAITCWMNCQTHCRPRLRSSWLSERPNARESPTFGFMTLKACFHPRSARCASLLIECLKKAIAVQTTSP